MVKSKWRVKLIGNFVVSVDEIYPHMNWVYHPIWMVNSYWVNGKMRVRLKAK